MVFVISLLEEAYIEATRLKICTCKDLETYSRKIQKIKENLKEETIESFENRFKVLANTTRLKILLFLIKQKNSCICEIASIFELDRGTLSYHLKLLQNVRIIQTEKVGKSKIIRLAENYETILPQDFLEKFKAQ